MSLIHLHMLGKCFSFMSAEKLGLLTTNQKVGSSNLSGRTISFKHYFNIIHECNFSLRVPVWLVLTGTLPSAKRARGATFWYHLGSNLLAPFGSWGGKLESLAIVSFAVLSESQPFDRGETNSLQLGVCLRGGAVRERSEQGPES